MSKKGRHTSVRETKAEWKLREHLLGRKEAVAKQQLLGVDGAVEGPHSVDALVDAGVSGWHARPLGQR